MQRVAIVTVDLEHGHAEVGRGFDIVAGFDWPRHAGGLGVVASILLQRIAAHDRTLVEEALRAALSGGDETPGAVSFDTIDRDGATRRLECSWTVECRHGRPLRLAVACAHLPKHMPSEGAEVDRYEALTSRLRLEHARLELALAAGRMGAFDLDIGNDVLWWSPGMYEIFGVSPDVFVPTREGVLTLMHPDDRSGFLAARRRAMAERRGYEHEFRALLPDGRVRWVAHFGRTQCDDEGRPMRTYGITMDVTQRRAQQEALREADRQKDRFIATLAHELRNPLAPIRNSVELLRRLPAGEAMVNWHSDVIDRQVTHMSHLLDDLLDVSRITRGTIQLRRSPMSLSTAVERALEVAMPVMLSLGHRVEVDVPEEPLEVHGDATRLAQIVSNLLINAAKYTPPGGRIELHARREGREAAIRVVDNGAGVDPDDLPRLFEMFGQLGTDVERSQSGLGIGLWLARALTHLHGGTLDAHSEGRGRGSEFSVRIPLLAARTAAPPAADHSEARRRAASAPLSVLIADDKVDIADSLAELLRLDGHVVHVAYNGDAAMEIARRVRPLVAVLDLGMPGRDGYDVCRALRGETWGAGMTLIAQTGWGMAEHRNRARDAGFDHHLVKPVDPADLAAILESVARVRAGTRDDADR